MSNIESYILTMKGFNPMRCVVLVPTKRPVRLDEEQGWVRGVRYRTVSSKKVFCTVTGEITGG